MPPQEQPDASAIQRSAKRISFWVSFFGWIYVSYWICDTVAVLSGETQLVNFLWFCQRGVIGICLVFLAKRIKRLPTNTVRLMNVVVGILVVRAVLMAFDKDFGQRHLINIVDETYSPKGGVVCGWGALFALISYVWRRRKEFKEKQAQFPQIFNGAANSGATKWTSANWMALPTSRLKAEREKCNMNTTPFKCPRCGIARETLDTPCLICNHTPEPQAKSAQTVTTQMVSSPRDVSTKTPAKTVAETYIGHASGANDVGWVYRNRKPVAVAVTVIVAALVAFAFKSRDHFYMVTDSRGQTFRIDKTTGQTWRIQGSQMTEVEKQEPQKAEPKKTLKALPLDEIAKLEGKAGVSVSRDSISGQIYNGSSWDVSELTVSVTGKALDGNKIWTRKFKVGFYAPSPVAPLSVGKFMFEIGDYFMKYDASTPFVDNNWAYNRANKLNDFDWNIEDAHGLPTE